MHLSSGHRTSKSVTSRGILNYQLLLLWIVFVSWSVGYSLGEPSSPLNCAEVKGDKDWFDCSSEDTNLLGWCDNAPLDGEHVAGKMQSNLSSVDEPAKGHFDLLFTSSESTSGRYGCESVEATQTAEVAVLGVIMMLILFIIGTMKSTDQRRNTSSRKYPYGNPNCPSRLLLCIAFILCSIAVFSESADGYEVTDTTKKVALLEEKVELNCIAKKPGPFKWYFKPYGSKVDQLINVNSQEDSNVSNAYSILTDAVGYSTLVIDGVILAHAGRYQCEDTRKKQKYYVELTVVDPNPVCNQSKETEASSIACRFLYVGNFIPDFDWLTSGNATFCNKSAKSYDSSTIGLLRIKGYKSPSGLGPCEPKEDEYRPEDFSSPLNYAAVNTEIVRLNCSKQEDDTGFWFRNTPLSADDILIYHKKIIRNGWFSIDESVPGRSDLLLKASLNTSGRYGCDLVGATHTAEVIVSDPEPRCSWEAKTGFVNASCSIGFSGNWPPVIDWYSPMGKVEANSTTTIPSDSVTSFLIVPLTVDPQELYFVTCSARFRIEDKPQEATVVNIPQLLLDTCRVPIEASNSRPAVNNKSGPKLNYDAFSESVVEYWQTESQYRIVLLDERVEFDCTASTSPPLKWYFKPYGSEVSEFINGSSQADSNVTNTNRILKEDSDHATLIIDSVLLTDAGRYECYDTDGQYKLSVEVTVVDPRPVCDESPAPSSIVCRFPYAGNLIPDFTWLISESTTLCNESAYDSSTLGSLRVKGYKSPAGHWQCEPKDEHEFSSPLNYAVVEGDKVHLNCSKKEDDTGYWFRNAPLSVDKVLIYHKKRITNDWFLVNESFPGRSDLLFTASNSTSGRYGCDSVDATHTAEVIVSDQQPSCSWEKMTGSVNASCSIGFSGNWPPVIDWYSPMGKVEASSTTTIPSDSVTSFLIAQLALDPKQLYSITCSVKFRIEDKPQETTATNIPEILRKTCGISIHAAEYANAAFENVIPGGMESSEHGDAAGAIDVDQAENIDPGPGAGNKGAPKWKEGPAENDMPKPSIGSGRESFVLLQLFLAFIAAFVGLGQF